MNYYEVLVSIKTETEGYKGAIKVKSIKETYLVDAMSVTEAEARVVKLFAQSGFSQDFEVIGVKGSKVIEVVNAEEPKKSKVTKDEDNEQEG
jgi:hypothetical protein